jgi:hypothetical protein
MNEDDWKAQTPEWLGGEKNFPAEWMDKLNVEANYISIHRLQGGSPRDSFRYGTYDPSGTYTPSKWPTSSSQGEQLSFFDESQGSQSTGRSSLRTAAQKFILALRRESVTDALSDFFDNVIDAGYIEELAMAYADVDEAISSFEDPFTTEVNLDLDDGSNAKWEDINGFVERMSMLNKG